MDESEKLQSRSTATSTFAPFGHRTVTALRDPLGRAPDDAHQREATGLIVSPCGLVDPA